MNQKLSADVLPAGYKLHWYELQSVLGRGAYGITYLALDANLEQLVAIKEYLPTEFASRQNDATVHPNTGEHKEIYRWGLDRFLREARTLAKFKHPNIVRVSSVFEKNNTAYMVMEYEHGEDLSKLLKRGQRFSEAELLNFIVQILDGLTLVHNAGIIHRDIKPSNIYVRTDGSPVLIDFGSARQTFGNNTNTLTSLVTYGYAPFEQYNESDDAHGPWTDIYALGASLYLAITGKLPIEALARGSALLDDKKDPYEPVSTIAAHQYSLNFLLAVDNALHFRAKDRPQNLAAWADMLTGKMTAPLLNYSAYAVSESDNRTNIRPASAAGRSSESSGNYSRPSASRPNAASANPSFATDNIPVLPENSTRIRPNNAPAPDQKSSTYSRRGKRRLLLVLPLLAVIVTAGVWVWRTFPVFSLSATPTGTSDTPQTNAQQSPALDKGQQQKIETLLSLANADILAQRFILPKEKNAAFHLRQVLELDPQNTKAITGLNQIIDKQIKITRDLATSGALEQTQNAVAELITIAPENPAVAKLQLDLAKELQDRQDAIQQLLTEAKRHYRNKQLVAPPNANALATYRQVLQLQADNSQAKQGINDIISYLAKDAEYQLALGDLDQAEQNISNIEHIDANSVIYKALRKKADVLQQKNQTISPLLANAREAFSAGRLIKPDKRSALYYYRQIQKIDPENSDADMGIKDLQDHFLTSFEKQLDIKNREGAAQSLEALNAIDRYSQSTVAAQHRFTETALPKKPDMEMVTDLIAQYRQEFENRNTSGLLNISELSPGREGFISQLFGNYKSFKIKVSGFKYIDKKRQGLANISITHLVNNNGQNIQPGPWSQFDIIVAKNVSGEWKVQW